MKKKKWVTIKEMLFLYLAINKIFYWFNTIISTTWGNVDYNIFGLVLNRLLSQDLLIIFSIIFFHMMEKRKLKPMTQYAIAYVAFLVVIIAQIWVMNQFFDVSAHFNESLGGFFVRLGYFGFFAYYTVGFASIAIALNLKDYFKQKSKKSAETSSANAGEADLGLGLGLMNDFSNALVCETCKDELRDKLNLFGQFVGEWQFDGIADKGVTTERHVEGKWIFSWILDGTAVQDVFICPSPLQNENDNQPSPNAQYSTSIRFYNQATDAWDMFYGISGAMRIFEGRQVGEQIVAENKGAPADMTQARCVFSDITPSSFRWESLVSHDGGVTWDVKFELSAKRKNRADQSAKNYA